MAALWISMVLGAPSKVSARATMHETGVDAHTFATFEYDSGALAHLECSFLACLQNEVSIVGETGQIKVVRPIQAPETYTILTRQGDEPDPMLIRGKSVTHTTPLDPPHIAVAPGYNFVGSQGFTFEAAAVQEAIGKGLTEHPEMPLDETLAMAKVCGWVANAHAALPRVACPSIPRPPRSPSLTPSPSRPRALTHALTRTLAPARRSSTTSELRSGCATLGMTRPQRRAARSGHASKVSSTQRRVRRLARRDRYGYGFIYRTSTVI